MLGLNDLLISVDSFLGSAPWFPFYLLGIGLFFTVYLRFPQIRFFKHAWKVLFDPEEKSKAHGETSHFQAMSMALSGTIGTGNMGGVALAIYLGGPAAIFWMLMTAFMGMTTKFVEVSLSHKYRIDTDDGTVAGGPMYVMDRGLGWKPLAVVFAAAVVLSSFGSGSMPQVNNIAQVMNSTFGIEMWISGLVLSVLLAFVIIGGITRIASFAAKVVPTMAAIYIIGSFCVIITNYDQILPSFISIFADAFTGSAAIGGFIGGAFAQAFSIGVARGLFSNEAGQGSSAIAHASAITDESVSEGMVSLLEPFIDTIMICTLTGLVILSSGAWTKKYENTFQAADFAILEGVYSDTNDEQKQALFNHLNFVEGGAIPTVNGEIDVVAGNMVSTGVTIINARSVAEEVVFSKEDDNGDLKPYSGKLNILNGDVEDTDVVINGKSLVHSATLTSKAFTTSFLGENGKYIVAFSLTLFAFSTAVAWSYYGDRAITYIFGAKGVLPYRICYVIGFFVAAISDTAIIWTVALITVALMTIPNVFCMFMMRKEVKEMVEDYAKKIKK
ncbi:MAG: sodium:alanine symporter family protein [Kordiimonadaceae bacterium]|jgi:alanine or glycine:cation symporter, AGCS family|nr:sodium:alanine symporter family protein [Kordiimonadaceae bacterium]